MRSEQEIKKQLAILEDMKEAIENQGWEGFFLQEKINLLKWVLGE